MKRNSFLLFTCTMLLSIFAGHSQTNTPEDPYLWLEDIESPKSLEWVKAQNAISDKTLTADPLFATFKDKFLKVYNDKEKIAYPTISGNYIYNLWQDETNVRGLWRRILKADYINKKNNWEVVLDIDELSKRENKKWVFSNASFLEPDMKICLLALSDGGKDENQIREFNTETKSFVKNGFFLDESKGGAEWVDKNNLLIFRNFGDGSLTSSGYPRQVKLWRRGTAPEKAKLLFETDKNNVGAWVLTSYQNNKPLIFIVDMQSFYKKDLYFLNGEKTEKIEYPTDANYIAFHKNEILISLQSDWKVNGTTYKEGSLVSFNLVKSLAGKLAVTTIWQPDAKSSFISASSSKDFITVNVLENVQNKLIQYKFENNNWKTEAVNAPAFGSIYLVASSDHSNDYFFMYSNFITPTTLYHSNGKHPEALKSLKAPFDTTNLEVAQYMVASKDGTAIPYFIVHKKNIELNGNNPTIINAYGGFNDSFQPDYSSMRGLGWLEQGGVFVVANIRGGGEFGPSWHQNAIKEKKQNSYDDFYAVSEDLIKRKITSQKHLGAFGWSNGGLMAGVVFTQRPDLYNAVVVGAPLLDMKRYSKLLAGASWMGEYGNPDIPEEWEYIKKYSPYQNVSKDKKYPEVFFVTSTKDDRVHPGHARKMAARMKEMGHPFIYHETIEGGHGAASTNEQQADMWAGIYTYFNMKLAH